MGAKRNASVGTPATVALDRAGAAYAVHQYEHEAGVSDFGAEAARKLGVHPTRIFKTLLVTDGRNLFVGVVPVSGTLDLRSLARVLGVKSLSMADPQLAQRRTGYVLGGISPLGHKQPHRTVIDTSATEQETLFVSAGKRGVDLEVAPEVLAEVCGATFAAIAAH